MNRQTPRERAEDLIRLLVPDWRPTPRQALWAIRIALVLRLLVAIGYSYGITLWDWIKPLVVVPVEIAAGASCSTVSNTSAGYRSRTSVRKTRRYRRTSIR